MKLRKERTCFASIKALLYLNVLLFLLCLFVGSAVAADVELAWDANTESDLAGYYVHYKTGSSGAPYDGTGANEGDSPIQVPLEGLTDQYNPNYLITGLSDTETYFFVVTAYNTDGDESDYSNEVSTTGTSTLSAPSVSGTTPTNDTTPTWSWSSGGGGNGTYRYKLDNSNLSSGATQTTATSYTPARPYPRGPIPCMFRSVMLLATGQALEASPS